ncbi:MAG: hypothetical protein LBE09_06550 [Christensenellaceae bacterium]|jgi:sporulation protein YabP|nr:hypothetical protein [Christensenellaceae bacterium]
MSELLNTVDTHSLSYTQKRITVTSVKDVINFDEKEILLNLQFGSLAIKGVALSVDEFNAKTGALVLSGKLISLSYENSREKLGLFKRFFK